MMAVREFETRVWAGVILTMRFHSIEITGGQKHYWIREV
jgi:hypothetical protein